MMDSASAPAMNAIMRPRKTRLKSRYLPRLSQCPAISNGSSQIECPAESPSVLNARYHIEFAIFYFQHFVSTHNLAHTAKSRHRLEDRRRLSCPGDPLTRSHRSCWLGVNSALRPWNEVRSCGLSERAVP